jgi:hypothetical protein
MGASCLGILRLMCAFGVGGHRALMQDQLPDEYELAVERFDRREEWIIRAAGHGQTTAGLAIAEPLATGAS